MNIIAAETLTNVVVMGGFSVLVALIKLLDSRQSRRIEEIHAEVKTNDGRRVGDYIEAGAKAAAQATVAATIAQATSEQVAIQVRNLDRRVERIERALDDHARDTSASI